MFDEQKFSKLYLDKTVPIKRIAEIFGVCVETVYTRAKRLDLQIRSEKKYQVPEAGTKFNRLTFIKEECGTGKRKYWLCSCECGKQKSFAYWSVFSGKTTSCGCYQKEKTSKLHWTGFEEISGRYWTSLQDGAKRRQLDFNVTIEEAWDVYLKQNKKCNLSGLDIEFSRMANKFPQTASLDRIDNSKGYVKNNIQWLHKIVNSMKHCMEQEFFVDFCCHIAGHTRNKEKKNV